MSLPPDLKIAHPNRFGGWVEGKTIGMNYYQAARGKDLCQDRARMKLALAATPCCITPHHIKSQILHCNVSHRFCRSRPSRAKLQTWDKVNRAALVTQGVWPAWKKHLSILHAYKQPTNPAKFDASTLMNWDLAVQQGSSNHFISDMPLTFVFFNEDGLMSTMMMML